MRQFVFSCLLFLCLFVSGCTPEKPKCKLVFFEAESWCSACRHMKNTTFQDAAVKTRLQQFNVVFVDVDKNPQLAEQLKIRSIPAYVLYDATGKMRWMATGVRDPKEFIEFLDLLDKP